ncbi:hypothetical protein [Reichenbachiella versicolor]|uniref:hypothetical protein n=1 Tax=Reichenbachiella versicolor TaxID=1821036 RepID=UPI000D6E26DA|nr:hypothetical protein [Reichenbachiella versicolor]
MNNQSIDSKLLATEITLTNALTNEAIKTAMAIYGYDETKFLAAKAMLDDTKIKHANQQKEYAEQYDLTGQIESQQAQLRKTLIKFAQIGRVIFKDDIKALNALGIKGRVLQTYSAFTQQAAKFVHNVLEDANFLQTYAQFGINQEDFEDFRVQVDQLIKNLASRDTEVGEAQQATQLRDNALEELMDWMSDFKVFARIALEQQPQMLEALGIVEPSE